MISTMNSTAYAPHSNTSSSSALVEENALLRAQLDVQADAIRQLTRQLDWFKKQLFGPKSEKQVYDLPGQDDLFQPADAPTPEVPSEAEKRPVRAYQRGTGKKQRDDDCLNDTGLRFTRRCARGDH